MQYWYNIATGAVESDDERGGGDDVMGPYSSRDEAAKALETAKRKTEDWDAQDRDWAAKGSTRTWSDEECED